MSIIFNQEDKRFLLETQNTEYAFSIAYDRFLRHEYYGKKRDNAINYFKPIVKPFSVYNEGSGYDYSPTNSFLEIPFFGCGDYRCTALRIQGKNGDSCTFFEYKNYRIFKGKNKLKTIPCARSFYDTETLEITMYDKVTDCILKLYYTLFPDCDVIIRSFTVENKSDASVLIKKVMPLCLDIEGHNFDMISLYGAQANERNVQRSPLSIGSQSITSRRGASGHNFNPFLALVGKDTTEQNGEVYAFNLIYSGSFLDEVEVDTAGNTRVSVGLGEENFKYTLESNEIFESPEAVMLYSTEGIGDMSRKMHRFIRNAIVPETINDKKPIVLNTWESFLFDIKEDIVLKFADEAAKYGADTLVIDDGWFGKRNNDSAGLGDWYVNKEKFPNGLKSVAERVKSTGLKFGIWIEPEMVNSDSDLYREHPDWCLRVHGRIPSTSRNQLVLDMCNPEVRNYIKKSLLNVFEGVPLDYVKWDFNRNLSEVGSYYLDATKQEETWYRWQLGVYELYFWFRETFPNVFLENCSGGGGRYDLAMMALSDQIWTSDNTNAGDRTLIQYGSSIAYPACVMSCHVSNPGKDENNIKVFNNKFHVALGGMLGYEYNIIEAEQRIKDEMLKQTEFYRKVEDLVKCGDLYRLIVPIENDLGVYSYCYTASEDMTEKAWERILVTYLQTFGTDNDIYFSLKIPVSDENAVYTDVLSNEKYTGKELKSGINIKAVADAAFSLIYYFKRCEE